MKAEDEIFDSFDDEIEQDLFDDDSGFDFGEYPDEDDEETSVNLPVSNEHKKRLIEGLTMEYAEFENRAFSSFQLDHFTLYGITFRNCTFDHIDCQCGKFIACKFEDCSIISFSGEGYGFRECEFTRCKWSGSECLDDVFYYSNCKYTDCTEEYD